MTEARANPLVAWVGAIALFLPAPAIAESRAIRVANCLGGMDRIDLPTDPTRRSGDECCNKGCHAANDRRKKNPLNGAGCC